MAKFGDVYELRTQADLSGLQGVPDALDDIDRATRDVSDSAEQSERSSRGAADGLDDLDRAALEARASLNDVDDAGDRAGDSTKHVGDESEKAGNGLLNLAGFARQALGALLALTGVGAISITGILGGGLADFTAWDSAMNQVQAQTGLTGDALAEFKDNAQGIFTAGWGEGVDDVAVSMAQVRNITGLEGDSLAALTEQALILRDTFGYEVTESVRAADTAMQNFDVSSEHMMDLITTAAQQTGDSTQDLLDTVNEYSADFAAAGYDADMMFQTLIQGSAAGIFNLDKVADGVREFSTRVQEGGDETRAAFDALFANTEADWMFVDYENGVQQSIGSTQDLYAAIQSGAVPISLVGDRLADSLAQIDDPLLRNQIGVALLGSIYEDVGDAAIEALNIQDEGLNEAAGATERAGDALQQGLQPAWDRFQRTVRTGLVNAISPYATAFLQRLIPALERAGAWLTATGIPAFVRFLSWLRATSQTALEVISVLLGFESVGAMFSALASAAGDLANFLGHLSPESLVLIGTVLAAMAAPAVIGALVAGVTALGGGLVAVTAAAWPLAAALAVVAAYETNFGGLRDRVNEFKQAVAAGDLLGAVQALGGALLAIPRGIADWVAAQIGIDPSGIDAWKNNAQMLGTILQALPGYLVAVIDQATGFNIPEAWESFRQTTNSIKNHIGSIVNRIAEFVAAAATIVLPAGLSAVRDTWDRIRSAASAVGGYVSTFIGIMAGIVLPAGLAAVQNTWTRVSDSASSAVGYVQRFIDALGRIQVPDALREAASLLDSAGGAISGAAGWVGDQLRDSGGPGAAGETYLIGRGAQPELFVPRSAGTFYPADSYALAGGSSSGGGDGVVITGPVHIYGVQDVDSLYEQLQKVGQRRAPSGGSSSYGGRK